MNSREAPIAIYGLKRNDYEKRLESQSGGAFALLAEYFLKQGAVVYGCCFKENLDVAYTRIDSIKELSAIKGSKYVRANLNDTFKQILKDLKSDKSVLYCGTACDIAGLKKFVAHIPEKDNLYTVDFICHGTPSHEIYREYLSWIEKIYKKKIVKFNFRDKDMLNGGWKIPGEKIVFEDGSSLRKNVYSDLFYTEFVLRPCCASCRYASLIRNSDFTVGDYWGVEKYFPDFYDNSGVSLILLNTSRSVEIFEKVRNDAEVLKTTVDKLSNPNLNKPTVFPKIRLRFWKCLKTNGFETALKKYTNYGGLQLRIKRFILKRINQW